MLVTCQMAAFLEIVHPAVGLVKTGVIAPAMQVLYLEINNSNNNNNKINNNLYNLS